MAAQNSTTGRTFTELKRTAPTSPRVPLRTLVSTLAAVSPELAARLLVRVWFTPPRRPIAESERAALGRGESIPLRVRGRRVAAWSFGSGPVVLLVHGWGGHAGQMLPFVEPLVEAGRRVVLFDSLAHGQSERSPLGLRMSSFVDAAACVDALVREVGAPEAIVAHSGGAGVTGLAMTNAARAGASSSLRPLRVVLIAPMARPAHFADRFEAFLQMPPSLARRWRALAEERVGFRWNELDLTTAPSRFEVPKTLVVQDEGDKEVPFDEGVAVSESWPNARLVTTTGLGHQRILRDPQVVEGVVEFIQEGTK